ncbi:MAG: YdbC family protein [Tissierellaceae bacterium]
MSSNFQYEITEHIGIISESPKGWTKEINLISWNNRSPKYDLRDWSPEHEKMGKGITFTKEELKALRDILNDVDL